jgi:putative ubiquitin-RnfH superfamily antitoxin RatB of RatAB toxin-antitoxin module
MAREEGIATTGTESTVRALVCYATPERIFLEPVEVCAGADLQTAIFASGVLKAFPQLDLSTSRTGVYGKLRPLETVVQEGDRIEIYRGLVADPKVARQRRVAHKRAEGTREGLKWRRGQS